MSWLETDDGDFVVTPQEPVEALPAGRYLTRPTPQAIRFEPIAPVVDELVPNPQAQKVIDEIDRFRALRPRYEDLGLTYKRGVLLHGAPGCGKTTVLNEVAASVVAADGLVLEGDPRVTQAAYGQVRRENDERMVVILIEDIDRMATSSTLTNLLDGSESSDNVLFLATTNYLATLPDRIKNRPSRFDTVVEMGFPKEPTRHAYLHRLGLESGYQRDQLVEASDGMSFAHLKELFIATQLYGQNVKSAAARLTKKPIEFASSDGPGTPSFSVPELDDTMLTITAMPAFSYPKGNS